MGINRSTKLHLLGFSILTSVVLTGCRPTASTENTTQPTRMDSLATQAIDTVTSMGVDSAGIRR